jgi:EAL domain-containing protein (putative c-di-GMP-specific phosphodiesterase class I)
MPHSRLPSLSLPPRLPFAAADVSRGIDAGEFRLVYQPKLNIRRAQIDGAEALVRWDHPQLGVMLPDRFIEASETGGSIAKLTLWTMQQALADQRLLRTTGHGLRLFVNLSAQLLTDEAMVVALCTLAGSDGADLGIEVTERSVIADPDLAFANIRRLREAGLCIAIDDYGTGLSSLTYLKQIEADELKIDKSFITSLGTSHRDPLIVRSTIDLAHALGMTVTAEGVETPAAHALLSVMGCDMVQGYLIGRPMRPEALTTYLDAFDPATITFPNDGRVLRDHKFWKRA